ncbi:MAG: transcriptional repressor LexA [Verrucomicrobiae bacterium]|nr:transcriptional repressor LexA [Verrucomicrobiae bacterium]
MKQLTDKQREVFEFVRDTIIQTGVAPTLREIAARFRFKSVKAAADHVAALRRKGVLTAIPRRARTLRLTAFLPAQDKSRIENGGASSVSNVFRRAVASLPIYGSIPAGFADERIQENKGHVAIDLELLGIRPTARTFVLEVRGDSMIGRHILDGDLVVLEHGRTPKNGDVVAALIDNESTLKTFVHERGRPPYLKAENPKYPRLYPASELVIQGVMVGLIRRVKSSPSR